MAAVITFTPNPAIDVSTSVDKLTPFRKLRCSAQHRDPGGGGINVARVLRHFGADVIAVYPSGGSTGELLRRLVEAAGIPGPCFSIAEETRESFTVFERDSAQQYRFVLPGGPLDERQCLRLLETLASVDERPRFVVASGSLPPGAPHDLYARAQTLAAQWGARFVLDTSGPALAAALEQGVYLIKPNLREFSELVGAPSSDQSACIEAGRRMIAAGRVEIIALTLGHRGALLITRDRTWRAAPLDIAPVSVVGAGDSFLGGMVFGLLSGEAPAAAFRRAVASGSAALLAPGTSLCQPADVERLSPLVKIERM